MRTCQALVLVALTGAALFSPGTELRAEEKRTAEWVDMSYAVTKADYQNLFSLPPMQTSPEFSAEVVVKPGSKMFDPFDFHVIDGKTVLASDDGKAGYIWKVGLDGKVDMIASTKRYAPYTFDIAPASFGKYEGQIYAAGFNEPERAGGWDLPNAVTRIDPATGLDTLICYLPDNGHGEPGAGAFFARFGPEGSPWAGRMWITTASNHTIYQITPDGHCSPFKTIDITRYGSPRGIAFTSDGKTMLLGATRPDARNRAETAEGGARIWRVAADGTIDDTPYATGLHEPGPMALAPAGFGKYAGDLFITDAGDWDNDVGIMQQPNIGPNLPVTDDGKVYHLTHDGKVEVIVSGLRNPVAIAFVGDTLLIGDINGDFHIGYQKIPDGFVVAIKPRP